MVATIAATVGDNLGFALGYYGGRPLLARYQAFFQNSRRDCAAGRRSCSRAMARSRSFLRALSSACGSSPGRMAGVLRMPWRKFVIFNFLGAALWVTVISGAGYLSASIGSGWSGALSGLTSAVAIVAAGGASCSWWRSRRARTKWSIRRVTFCTGRSLHQCDYTVRVSRASSISSRSNVRGSRRLHRLRPSRNSDEEEHMKKIGFLTLLILVTVLFTLAFSAAAAGPKARPQPSRSGGSSCALRQRLPAAHPHIHEALEVDAGAKHHLETADMISTAIGSRRSSTWIRRSTKLRSANRSRRPEVAQKN